MAISPQLILASEQIQAGLTGTIKTWDRFQETDLVYFDDITDSARSIDNEIQHLRELEDSLRKQTEIFKSVTSKVSYPFVIRRWR